MKMRLLPKIFSSHIEQKANTVTVKLPHAERRAMGLAISLITYQAAGKQGHRSKETVPGHVDF